MFITIVQFLLAGLFSFLIYWALKNKSWKKSNKIILSVFLGFLIGLFTSVPANKITTYPNSHFQGIGIETNHKNPSNPSVLMITNNGTHITVPNVDVIYKHAKSTANSIPKTYTLTKIQHYDTIYGIKYPSMRPSSLLNGRTTGQLVVTQYDK